MLNNLPEARFTLFQVVAGAGISPAPAPTSTCSQNVLLFKNAQGQCVCRCGNRREIMRLWFQDDAGLGLILAVPD